MKKLFTLKRRELILLFIWLIILLVVLIYFSSQKAIQIRERLRQQIVVAEEKLQRLRVVLRQRQFLEKKYGNIFQEYKLLKDSDHLLQEVEAVARGFNVNIVSIKPLSSKEFVDYRTVTIRIEIQDDIAVVVKFLRQVIEKLRCVRIERMQINVVSKEEWPKTNIFLNAVLFKL
ncbi:MAG: type 4a pilus biogenesis protein PilO [Candidatus Omnitrophica bacterium]|nr:type 4a pilus biogenesis protein PilO [Candidatus Omnitrophota bacterium]